MADETIRVDDGLATFAGRSAHAMAQIETRFRRMAAEFDAQVLMAPPLVRVADLDRIDYFENFPHLGSWVSPLKAECLEHYTHADSVNEIPARDLGTAAYALPSAACYGVYTHLRDRTVDESQTFTLTRQCFRREDMYRNLDRLWGFHMQEVVCVGAEQQVKDFLRRGKAELKRIVEAIGLPIVIETAQDPFFSKENPRLAMQKMFPTKEEFQFSDRRLAIASVNFHHNFFGERFDIRLPDGTPAFTGCVAMGQERWLAALLDFHSGDLDAIETSLAQC